VDYKPDKVSPKCLLAINPSTNAASVVYGSIESAPHTTIRVLLDSGSSGESGDYVSMDMYNALNLEKAVHKCECTNKVICGFKIIAFIQLYVQAYT
jgi:hypothetical protein